LETYDLDVQLKEFVGAALLEKERYRLNDDESNHGTRKDPLWTLKPSMDRDFKGQNVLSNLMQIIKYLDSGGSSRVAQKYIVSS